MKKPFIPLEKRSKKEQRAWYAKRRRDWNGVPPATRIIPSKKHYNRKKQRREQFPDAVFALQGIDGRGNGPQRLYSQVKCARWTSNFAVNQGKISQESFVDFKKF